MSNVHTLKDINKGGHRLGSVYEQELKEKLRSTLKFNDKINDLNEKLVDKYTEREEEFHHTISDVGNKISQANATITKLSSKITSERISCTELEAKYSAEIKSLKSSIKTLKREVTLAQKASSFDKIKNLSLEAKVGELEAKLEDLEQVSHDSNVVGGLLEEPAQINLSEMDSLRLELKQVKDDLSLKKYEFECLEKGVEAKDIIFKRELDSLSSARLNLMEENTRLRELVSKKNNEPTLMNDVKESGGEQLSALTAPIIASSLMLPMITYSILTLLVFAIIWFVVRKKIWNSWKKTDPLHSYSQTRYQ